MKKHPKSLQAPKRRKNSKNIKNMTKKWDASFRFWDPKAIKSKAFWLPKNHQKLDPQNRHFLGIFFPFWIAKASILDHFGYQKCAPAHGFLTFFRKQRFCQNRAPTVARAQF